MASSKSGGSQTARGIQFFCSRSTSGERSVLKIRSWVPLLHLWNSPYVADNYVWQQYIATWTWVNCKHQKVWKKAFLWRHKRVTYDGARSMRTRYSYTKIVQKRKLKILRARSRKRKPKHHIRTKEESTYVDFDRIPSDCNRNVPLKLARRRVHGNSLGEVMNTSQRDIEERVNSSWWRFRWNENGLRYNRRRSSFGKWTGCVGSEAWI